MTPEQLAAWREKATRPRRTVPIVLDGTARGRIEELEDALDAAESDPAPGFRMLGQRPPANRAAELRAELAAARTAAGEATLTVVVEGLTSTVWRALLAAHPMRRGADGKLTHPEDAWGANEETVRVPMVRGSIVEIDGAKPDLETVDWLLDFVTDRQMDNLVGACMAVNRGDDAVPLPRPRSTTPTSGDE